MSEEIDYIEAVCLAQKEKFAGTTFDGPFNGILAMLPALRRALATPPPRTYEQGAEDANRCVACIFADGAWRERALKAEAKLAAFANECLWDEEEPGRFATSCGVGFYTENPEGKTCSCGRKIKLRAPTNTAGRGEESNVSVAGQPSRSGKKLKNISILCTDKEPTK